MGGTGSGRTVGSKQQKVYHWIIIDNNVPRLYTCHRHISEDYPQLTKHILHDNIIRRGYKSLAKSKSLPVHLRRLRVEKVHVPVSTVG